MLVLLVLLRIILLLPVEDLAEYMVLALEVAVLEAIEHLLAHLAGIHLPSLHLAW